MTYLHAKPVKSKTTYHTIKEKRDRVYNSTKLIIAKLIN